LGVTVIVGVGQLNYRYSKRYGVVYVPVYLFNAKYEFMTQIGVYEMPTNDIKMDDSGDIEINKMTPLLYGTFVNTTLLRQSLVAKHTEKAATAAKVPPAAAATATAAAAAAAAATAAEIKKSLGGNDQEAAGDSDSDDANISVVYGIDAKQSHALSGASILPLQTKDQSELERKQYKFNPRDLWVQKY